MPIAKRKKADEGHKAMHAVNSDGGNSKKDDEGKIMLAMIKMDDFAPVLDDDKEDPLNFGMGFCTDDICDDNIKELSMMGFTMDSKSNNSLLWREYDTAEVEVREKQKNKLMKNLFYDTAKD
jgi:hypothetical protein